MASPKIVKGLILSLVFTVLVLGGFAGLRYLAQQPPVAEINKARKALAKAKNYHAGKFAAESLREAQKLFDKAMTEWNMQNEKFFAFRNFAQAKELANQAVELGNRAQNEAAAAKGKYLSQLESKLQNVDAQTSLFEKNYKELPVGRSNFDKYNEGKLKYMEAVNEFEKNDLQKSMLLAVRAGEKLSQAGKSANEKLKSFFSDYPTWEKDEKFAVQLSKKGQTVLLIDKMEATCMVLKGGKIVKVCDAEFGPNWMGDKSLQGDRVTPQGRYKVTQKKKGAKTKFHKALLLDYPNEQDRARFDQLKKHGKIAGNAKIGGLIEIHGGGGKQIHWTDGCIALENNDMDAIYNFCQAGTPVFIIGSSEPFSNYFTE